MHSRVAGRCSLAFERPVRRAGRRRSRHGGRRRLLPLDTSPSAGRSRSIHHSPLAPAPAARIAVAAGQTLQSGPGTSSSASFPTASRCTRSAVLTAVSAVKII